MTAQFPLIENESSGKRALVTGGTGGIGEAIVSLLLSWKNSILPPCLLNHGMICLSTWYADAWKIRTRMVM
jgi:hypothetical protein